MGERIRILIADDHKIIRWGLRSVLDSETDMEVVGEAGDGLEALEKVRTLQPDVVLLDLVMPHLDGMAAIQAIRQEKPDVRILILTSHEDDTSVIEAIKAGALGYLFKNFELDNLLHAVREVYRGNLSLAPHAVQKLMRSLQQPATPAPVSLLTEREQEVLRMIGRGLSNQEIAESLSISKSTVRTHISNVLSKLGLSNRTQVALYAVEAGLVNK